MPTAETFQEGTLREVEAARISRLAMKAENGIDVRYRANGNRHGAAIANAVLKTGDIFMKTLKGVLLAVITLLSATAAFAGRDQVQLVQQERAIKAVKAERLAQQKQAEKGLAGPTGVQGKVGPSGQTARVRKDPTAHP